MIERREGLRRRRRKKMSSKHSALSNSKVNEMGKRKYSPKPFKPEHPVSISSPTPLANLSLNSVLLHDWWLGMAQPRGLAVVGFECRGRQGQRLLCSAAIAKRHDATNLETADGITISISGFINTSRTLENGFPPQVCSDFLFGFPYDWEKYASPSSNEEYVSTGLHGVNRSSGCNANFFLPASLDGIPATRLRDLQMFSAGDSHVKRKIFDHVQEKLSTRASQHLAISVDSDLGNKHPDKKVKVFQNHIDDNNISCSRSKRRLESQNEGQSRTPATGVTTRSMTRLKCPTENQGGLSSVEANGIHCRENRKHKPAKNLPVKSFTIPKSNPQLSTSEPCTMDPGKIRTRSASRGSHATTSLKEEK